MSEQHVYARPVPQVGDRTSAAQRAADPTAWALPQAVRDGLAQVVGARRDVRRYRPDPVPDATLRRVLESGHAAPSVGHSQPWRFVVVRDPATRERAALMADRCRLEQAAGLDADAGRRLLALQLEGIREAPVGVVVACDRRAAPQGVLGRATFPDADVWSCACAIENMWLTARAEGLGLGWVTLFDPDELAGLLGLPDGVVTLGWLCLGWPDERPPAPGLERAGWSRRTPLEDVVLAEGWPDEGAGRAPAPPPSRLRAPAPPAVVAARDAADVLLTPPSSLGVLDRAVDRVLSLGPRPAGRGTLVLAVGRHGVVRHGVSAYDVGVTEDVLAAARAGTSYAAVAARSAGLALQVVDAGSAPGDLRTSDPMTPEQVRSLLRQGRELGTRLGSAGPVALGELGTGNTTVAAALAASLLGLAPPEVVGLGAGADSAMVGRKEQVVAAALERWETQDRSEAPADDDDPAVRLAVLGGPELALLTGVVQGAAGAGAVVVLDGLATGVCALLAVRAEPGVAAHLVAGQRSNERAADAVLAALGLEPLLDLRLRAGEGVGAALAAQLLHQGLDLRLGSATTG